MQFVMNPGTEPVEGATLENAERAMAQLMIDIGRDGATYERDPEQDGRGRFGFLVTHEDRRWTVEMPGCDPDITLRGQPWVSPRLYVNGSSWLYGFALNRFDDDEDGWE